MRTRIQAPGALLISSLCWSVFLSAQSPSLLPIIQSPTEEESIRLQPGGRFDALVYLSATLKTKTGASTLQGASGALPSEIPSSLDLLRPPSEREAAILMPGGAFDALEKSKKTSPKPSPPPAVGHGAESSNAAVQSQRLPEAVQKALRMPDGSAYYGWLIKDKPEGFGLRLYLNGEIYAGHWKAGSRNGIGVTAKGGKTTYKGYWAENRRDGMGMLNWENGTRYAGQWKDGRMDGLGILAQADGRRSGGKWKQNSLAEPATIPKEFFANPVFRSPSIGVKDFGTTNGLSVQGILLDASSGKAWILRASDRKEVRLSIKAMDSTSQTFVAQWQRYFGTN